MPTYPPVHSACATEAVEALIRSAMAIGLIDIFCTPVSQENNSIMLLRMRYSDWVDKTNDSP